MPFRYLKDPLFLCCLALYFVNRWVIKPCFPNEFSRCHFNDLICLPFWVPIMLFIMRKAGWRRHDGSPTGMELSIPLLLWSWVFELFLPKLGFFQGLTTADYRDILFYTIGAALAAVVWRLYYGEPSVAVERQSGEPDFHRPTPQRGVRPAAGDSSPSFRTPLNPPISSPASLLIRPPTPRPAGTATNAQAIAAAVTTVDSAGEARSPFWISSTLAQLPGA